MNLAIENAQSNKKIEKEFIDTIKRQTKRLIRINEDLLYLERRSVGRVISNVNISELLEDVLEVLQPSISKNDIRLKLEIEKDLTYKIDPKDFVKISRNILENAIKFTERGKSVKVCMTSSRGAIELLVVDEGIGIPKEDLAHIGERFFRAKNSSKIDGTGLGIAIVQKVLNAYGGTLEIKSQLKKGTEIKIIL